ncbi:MAG: hypothetical protein ACRDVC_06930 [Acidimicrobiales bacterium]
MRYVGAALAIAGVAYAWLATGVKPFTDSAYILLSVPSVVALAVYGALGGFSPRRRDVTSYYRSRGASIRAYAWIIVFGVALGLEIAGLALGGRSKDVPTLSTTIDRLLVTHWGRWLLFVWWLWVGVRAIERLARVRREEEPA